MHATYGGTGAAGPALAGVSLAVRPGEIVALVGANGSGKSSVLRTASGILRPFRGRVLLGGTCLRQLAPGDVARRVAVVAQAPAAPVSITGREMVMLGRTPYLRPLLGPTAVDRAAVVHALAITQAGEFADRLVEDVSGGERQRLVLARALAQEPAVLLLDEPTASLDLRHQVATLDAIRGLALTHGVAVLAALHDLHLAALYADRVVLLCAGRSVADGPPEAVLTPPTLRAAFDQEVVLAHHPTHGVPLVTPVPGGHARRVDRSGA